MTTRHLAECERCRALYEWIEETAPSAELPADLLQKIQGALKASLRRVSPRAATGVLATQFLIGFCILAAAAIAIVGTAGFRQMTLGQIIGMSIVLMSGVTLMCVSLAWQMTPGSRQRYLARVLTPILAGSFVLAALMLFPWHVPEDFLARGSSCLESGLLVAFPAAVLFWLLVRRGTTLDFRSMGASLGAIAGLAGVVILQFRCIYQDLAHLLIWHEAVLVVSICSGVLIAYEMPWRDRRRRR